MDARALVGLVVAFVLVNCKPQSEARADSAAIASAPQAPARTDTMRASGKVAVGGKFGNWTGTMNSCRSGEHAIFFGADVVAREDPRMRLRLVEQPLQGRAVQVSIADEIGEDPCPRCINGPRAPRIRDRSMVLTGADCKTFETSLESENGMSFVNRAYYWRVRGHMRLDCKRDGTAVVADVVFENCD